jgi:Flp pilus assembly CpaE family ATPase
MMSENSLILTIHDRFANGESILQALEPLRSSFRVQGVERLSMAQARISGGGVAAVVMDVSCSKTPETDKLEGFRTILGAARDLPIVVVCESHNEGPLMTAIDAAGAACVLLERCGDELAGVVCAAVEKRPRLTEPRLVEMPESRPARRTITFIGAKGGVGTTTVALNVAAVLSHYSRVILAELTPSLGALSNYLHLQHPVRSVADLLKLKPSEIDGPALETCLWEHGNMPGWNMLFAPRVLDHCTEIAAQQVKAILAATVALADYVVLDLPAALSEANRTVIQNSTVLGVVVERDPMCLAAVKEILKAIQFWQATPALIGAIIVNRAAFASPLDLADMELQLGIPTLGVIPPASDLCIAAYKAHSPVVAFDPESLAAQSFSALAERLAARAWAGSSKRNTQ